MGTHPASAATRADSANVSGPLAMTQSLDEELQYLQEEKVVTAVRHEQPISESPSNIYVITAEDIRQSGATDIPTLLRRVPGMEVMQTTGADFNVSVRGNNQLIANRILVLIDGRSIYLDGQGTVLWPLLPVTLPEISRIEVLKGPASAVYGFNAFDGVVNIITTSPEKLKGTTFQIGAGEFGTIRTAAVHAGAHKLLRYRVSTGWDQNQQWNNRDGLAFRAYKFNLHTDYTLGPTSTLSASGGIVDSNRFDGQPVGAATLATEPSQGYANLLYENSNILLHFWWNRHSSTSEEMFPAVLNLFRQIGPNGSSVRAAAFNTYNALGQYTLNFEDHRLTLGGNYRFNTVSGDLTGQF
ncbi:MAG: TonB-dependent receptor plug domain-containing protein [Nitrospirae bacterium]|nr:TonB-dependent receptor plug domain-containing protein [Nitrospirota bacterium]MDA1304609.1 TonB-dependent receptor plug domain-containing protein [Nitrospirota bacterium]